MKVERATFEQVKEAQNTLKFDYIEELIEKNEIIGEKSRKIFFENIAIALLGLEINYDFYLKYNGGIYNMGNLAMWVRKFLDFQDNNDKKQELFVNGNIQKIDNKILWSSLLENLYQPMAKALTLSLTVSAETLTREGGGFVFRTDEKIRTKQQ